MQLNLRHGRQTPFPQMISSRKSLFLLICLLLLIGIVFVFEASATESLDIFADKYTLTIQQLKWLGVGLVGFFASQLVPTKLWRSIAYPVYGLGLLTLLMIFIPGIGVNVNGAHRWVSLFGTRFQPVEIMKFGLVLALSHMLVKHQRLSPFLVLIGLPVTLVMLQPDLGSTLILSSIAFGLYVVSGADLKLLLGLGGFGALVVALLIMVSPYRRERLRTFMDPTLDPHDTGYHVRQITLALGNGGLLGTGLGQSKQKFRYIPELSTDSIFAIIAEETGFIGSMIVIGLFASLIFFSFKLTKALPDKSFEQLAATGIVLWIASQTILNLSAVVALVPLTGIPLPLISRGGTSLVTIMVALGMLFALTKESNSVNKPQIVRRSKK